MHWHQKSVGKKNGKKKEKKNKFSKVSIKKVSKKHRLLRCSKSRYQHERKTHLYIEMMKKYEISCYKV